MLSRVAEQLYWLGRYVERAENTARLVKVNGNLVLDLPRAVTQAWEPLIGITGSGAAYRQRYADFEERNVVRFLIGDTQNPGSILSSLSAARENTRTIRDILPRESWELVNELYLHAKEGLGAGLSKRGRFEYLDRVILGAQTFVGMVQGTMNHNAGYDFLRIGRIIEQADMTTRIIDVRSADLLPDESSGLLPFENIQWISVLKSLSGYQMYRQKMQSRVRRADVLRFLLQDDEFPRAFYRCVTVLGDSVRQLPRAEAVQRSLARLQRAAQGADIVRLAESHGALHAFVDELQIGLAPVHDEIARTWFLPEASAAAQVQAA